MSNAPARPSVTSSCTSAAFRGRSSSATQRASAGASGTPRGRRSCSRPAAPTRVPSPPLQSLPQKREGQRGEQGGDNPPEPVRSGHSGPGRAILEREVARQAHGDGGEAPLDRGRTGDPAAPVGLLRLTRIARQALRVRQLRRLQGRQGEQDPSGRQALLLHGPGPARPRADSGPEGRRGGGLRRGGCSFAGTGTGTGAHPPTRQTPPPSWPRSWR